MRIAMSSSSSLPIPFSTRVHQQNYSATSSLSQKQHQPPELTYQIDLNSPPPKPKTIRFRLSQLCRQGQLNLARQLFDAIPQPTTVLWNTLIIGYICNNISHEAINLYSRMYWVVSSSQDRDFDAYTYSSVLKACAEAKDLSIGKAVHCHLLRLNVYPSRIVYNSLLNMYASCCYHGDDVAFDLVERVFRIMQKRNVVSWNTMISWYAKTGWLVEAVRYFVKMLKTGLRPTAVSFVNVFPAVSGLGNVEVGHVLYGMVVKLGSEYVDDLFVVSSAISMYAELGFIDFARKIFDSCLEKNAHVWNAMISGYVQNDCPIAALEFFNEAMDAEDNSSNFDDVTFILALNAASDLQNFDISQQLHSCLIKKSLVSTIILVNAVIALYSRCHMIGDSFKVFNGMVERDVVSWNTMISALVQNGLDEEALMLVLEMQNQGFLIDDVTISALLSAASNLRDLETGKQTHAYLIRHGFQFNGVESYLIDMYAKAGLIEAAERVFRNCKGHVDHATWNAIISGCTQNGAVDKCFNIFQLMLNENIVPNAVTLASILPSCSQTGTIAFGKMLHGFAIRNFLDINIFVNSALVDMYSKSGAIAYAERVFAVSSEKNSVTCTNMILGYGQHGMGEKAVALFYSMKDLGINPDAITFVAVLSACSYTGLIDEGLEIFDFMESKYKIKPSTEHYACVVDMLGRIGRVFEAYDFAKQLGKEGNVLGIWGSLLAACKLHKEFELGKVVAKKLLEIEGAADKIAGYHVLLSNIHAEEENWDYVKGVRNKMVERGLVKEVGCSWINTSGYTNYFVSRDKQHPQCAEIYQLLKHLFSNLKDAGYMPPFLPGEI